MANRFHNPRPQFMNATPVVYSAGILRFYASGTSTPQNVYSGSDLTGASTTITLNSAGRPSQDIFLSNSLYKVTLEDSLGNIIWTVDPYMTSDYTTTAKVTGYSGNPNTHVAGTASAGAVPADMVWDRSNNILYVCTTTGVAAAAVWTVANSTTSLTNWTTAGRNVSPVEGVDFGYNTTLHRLEFWNATAWVGVPSTFPTVQRLTSGTAATYTAATGTVRQRVRMIGPGGGGGATLTNDGAAGSAATSLQVNATGTAWTAAAGSGGVTSGVLPATGGAGGTGGTDGSTGTLINRVAGGAGGPAGGGTTANVVVPGGIGGSGAFGGAGTYGGNAATNSGGGGGGSISASASGGGGGGGSGQYVEFWVTGMATALYTVGTGGAGGAAGTRAGGNGAAGIIIIEEFYS